MADTLDKFVLQYQVDLKDAIGRLETLNNRIDKVGKTSGGTLGKLRDFTSGATDELSRLVPGIDKVTSAIRSMGSEFTISAIALTTLAAGVKSVIDLRARYNEQRSEGMSLGVSATRVEEYQRKFVRASGGYVSRDGALGGVRRYQEMLAGAYADPTRMSTENRQLKLLGLSPGERGQGVTPLNQGLTGLASSLKGLDKGSVQGVAKNLGMSPDFLLTLQKIGPAIGTITEQSRKELETRQEAEQALSKYNEAFAQFKEQMVEAETVLGQKLLPVFTKFVGLMKDAAALITPDRLDALATTGKITKTPEEAYEATKDTSDTLVGKIRRALHIADPTKKAEYDKQQQAAESSAKETAEQQKTNSDQANKTAQATNDKYVDELDKQNAQGAQTASDMALAVNMFSGAVASFSNAVDERQAWAAWAGEIGRAAGMGTKVSGAIGNDTPESKAGPTGSTAYDTAFNMAAKKYNIDPNLLKRIAFVESKMNPNAESEKGALGLMQVIPSNFKSLGIKDGRDPTQSILGGAKLFREYLDASKGDVRTALTMYHGGYDRSQWGPRTRAYADKVLGAKSSNMSWHDARGQEVAQYATGEYRDSGRTGESRGSILRLQTQKTLADRLGVPLSQIQQGAVNRDDVGWAYRQTDAGVRNNITGIKTSLQNQMLTRGEKAALQTQLREQEMGLRNLQQFGPGVVGDQVEGGRNITIGERAIIINVTGSGNPEEAAKLTQQGLNTSLKNIVNNATNGLSH